MLKEIKAGHRYKKFQKILEAAQKKVDLDRDRSEALASHASLIVRTMYGKKRYSPKTILEAVGQVQSNRSRLVELRVRASVHLSYVEEASKAFRRYIYTAYADDLKEFKTKDQRDAMLQRATGGASDFIAEGNALIDLIDHLIKDLDQSSHSLRHMLDVLKLLAGSKGTNIV